MLAGSAQAGSAPTITDNTWAGQTLVATAASPADASTLEWWQCDATGANCTDTTVAGPDSPALVTGDTYYVVETGTTAATSATTAPVTADPPANSAAPVISGTATVGDTLSVQTDGTWGPPSPASFTYQWLDCSSAGCSPILGQTTSSYTLGSGDVGYQVEVAETPVYDGTTTFDAVDSNASARVGETTLPQHAPAISGTAQVGQTLRASAGTWSPTPTGYAYQWESCGVLAIDCSSIAGATGATYSPPAAEVGHVLEVAVTAFVYSTATGPIISAPTGVVAATAVPVPLQPTLTPTSTVQIVASPKTATVDEPVTLVGIVTSNSSTVAPRGTLTFNDDGAPIAGCSGLSVPGSGQSVTVTCATSFGLSTPVLSASFAPAAGVALLGSSSATTSVSVRQASSTTSLDVSHEVQRNSSTTYTASIAAAENRAGPVLPTGTVTFLDHGKRIAGCGAVRIVDAGATCTVKYSATGSQSISARYAGDASFRGSTSRTETVHVVAPTAKLLGRITATMQWTFHYTPAWTRIMALVVHGAGTGSTVTVRCSGKGCPFKTDVRTVTKPKPCHATKKHACPAPGTVNLESSFRRRDLRVHARVTITISRQRFVGKYYRFVVRARKQPAVKISCLTPGSDQPGAGCTSS